MPHGWTRSMEQETATQEREQSPGCGQGRDPALGHRRESRWCEQQGRQGSEVKGKGDAFRRLWVSARSGDKPAAGARRWVPGMDVGGGRRVRWSTWQEADGRELETCGRTPGQSPVRGRADTERGVGGEQRVEGSRTSLTESSQDMQES